jgi:hypothetical protein
MYRIIWGAGKLWFLLVCLPVMAVLGSMGDLRPNQAHSTWRRDTTVQRHFLIRATMTTLRPLNWLFKIANALKKAPANKNTSSGEGGKLNPFIYEMH